MPRNYQRTKNNPYLLPHKLYMRVLYIIKDYDRLKDEYRAIVDFSLPELAGMPGSSETANPTEDKAIKAAAISDELHAIEQALMMVPPEYRQGLMNNIKYRTPYPYTAHYNTWRYWRYKYTWNVAKRLHLV